MIWNHKAECMPVKEREQLQTDRLRATVKIAYENVPYYRKKFDRHKVSPDDIKTLRDIKKLPMTTKDDLREVYPFGMFAVNNKDIVEIHT